MAYKHFDLAEFDSPDLPGSGRYMDTDFLEMLDEARELAGIPFKITSGFRTSTHNAIVGGVHGSAHTTGEAVDILCEMGADRTRIIWALARVGIDRIGVYPRHVHADIAEHLPRPAFWQGEYK